MSGSSHKNHNISAKVRKQVRDEKRQSKRHNFVMLVLIAIIVLGIGLFLASSGSQITYSERFDLDPVLGDADAPVTVVEYGAYGCHACGEWHRAGIIDQILDEYTGDVKFVYRDMPIITPAYSQAAAEVAQCALDQGNTQFWTLHNAIFDVAQIGVTSQSQMIDLGAQLGLDGNALSACVDANTHRDTVLYDLNRGRELGINSTPVFLINGQRIFNASPEILRRAIDQALRS